MKTGLGTELQIYMKPLLLTLGLSCYWVWFISGLFSTSVWYGMERSAWPLVLVTNAATLMVLFAFAPRSVPFVQRMPFVAGAGLVTCAGIVLATLGFNIQDFAFMIVPGGVLTGVGSAPLILFWREVSEPLASKRVERVLVAVSVLFAMFFYLFFITLPFVVALVICSAAPLASAFLFRAAYFAQPCRLAQPSPSSGASRAARREDEAGADDRPSSPDELQEPTSSPSVASLVALLACCGALAVGQGVFKTAPPTDAGATAWPLVVSCALLAAGIVIALDSALAARAPRRLAARAFLPLTIIATALVACSGAGGSLSSASMFASYFLFLVYTFSELDSVASKRFTGVQILALGLCVVDLGFLLGMSIGSALSRNALPFVGIVLAAAGVLAVAVRLRCAFEEDRFAGRREDEIFVAASSGPVRMPDDMAESIGRQSAFVARAFALSQREEEILAHLACGKTAKTIAADAFITYNTVKTHISHIYQKTGVHTREELIALVVQQGERTGDHPDAARADRDERG